MWTIEKTFRFEAAHRLVQGYPGKCANIHGHSWIVRVKTIPLPLNEYSMALDFSALKPLGSWIDETFDHSLIVSSDDIVLLEWAHSNAQKVAIINRLNPTSEAIARQIYNQGSLMGLTIGSVIVEETCTCRCEYLGKDEPNV